MRSLEDMEKSAGTQLAKLLNGRIKAILESANLDKVIGKLQPRDLQSINSLYRVLVYRNGARLDPTLKRKLMNDLYRLIGAIASALYNDIYLDDINSEYFSGIMDELKESYKLL